MVLLRRCGFSSSQISELSGGIWSSTLVRQYTKNWGVVDIELDNQRKSLMTPLRELVSSGKDINDVIHVLNLERSVRAKGSSLVEVAELNSNLMNMDMQPGEVGMLITLSSELHDQLLTPKSVKGWMALDQELIESGFNTSARILLQNACEKYGGVVETLNSVNAFNDLSEIHLKYSILKPEVERLRSEKEEFDAKVSQNRNMINAVNNAYIMGFDTFSLPMISVVAKDLGGPYKVVTAIQKYGSIREIDEELEAKQAELENLKKEIINNNVYLTAIQYTLEEAKQTYEKAAK